MRLYTASSIYYGRIAYVLDGGGSGYQIVPGGYTPAEAEYLAVIYGLNEYFLKWNNELDARFSNIDPVTRKFHDRVGTPSDRTARPLPPPVLICLDNETIAKQLSRQYHISNDRLRKLAQQIWKMTERVEVKYQWIPISENLAGNMLK